MPSTINGMLDAMQAYVNEARPIEASDATHDKKIELLTVLSRKHGLYE
jgi:hypothetical protein|tara:strand:- start:1134 stop:1277 length:144 start_codon:yes stop_codon:yes gene_type:complete